MKKIKIFIISMIFVLLSAYFGTSYYILSSIVYNQRIHLTESPEKYNLSYENVSFSPRGEKIKLRGWYLPSTGEYNIIFVHGIGANRISSPNTIKTAQELVKKGYNILLFDQRAQGESEGEFSSAGWFEKYDVLGAFDYLINDKKILPSRIGVYGTSMGGTASILAAALEPRIRALVVDSPFASAPELVAQETALTTGLPRYITKLFNPPLIFFAKKLYSLDIPGITAENAVKKINFPILIIHGTADTRVPIDHSKRIHKNSARSSELWEVKDTGHSDAYKTNPETYIHKVSTYFDLRFLF